MELLRTCPCALLSNISTWQLLRKLVKCEKHLAGPRASVCSSLVLFKNSRVLFMQLGVFVYVHVSY